MIFKMKYFIKKYSLKPLAKYFQRFLGFRFYQNINLDPVNDKQKKVLISYITDSFKVFDARHTNVLESAVIIKTFIDMGYCVDVIHCQDEDNVSIMLQKQYDVIFGFGVPFYEACKHNIDAKKIIYLTEAAPEFSRIEEKKREEYLLERHGWQMDVFRTGMFFFDEHIKQADYGVLLGNDFTKLMYNKLFPRLRINTIVPTGMINKDFTFKKYKSVRDFVWFGSMGAIHKGLDILLDVFSDMPERKLFICGLSSSERWLLDNYKKCSNIIDLGFLDIQSDDFLNLINSVRFVILPSCSEGMSTSVLTCMRHGLIPIVTEAAGVDVGNFGIKLYDYHVDYIKAEVVKLLDKSDSELEIMSEQCYEFANDNFSITDFAMAFNKQIRDFL